jgi:TPR repeat protein
VIIPKTVHSAISFSEAITWQRCLDRCSRNSHNLQLAIDQGLADAQCRYGFALKDGAGTQKDGRATVRWGGKAISKEAKRAARYFTLGTYQELADRQYRYGIWLLGRHNGYRDIARIIQYPRLEAENGSPQGLLAPARLAENDIGPYHRPQSDTVNDTAMPLLQAPWKTRRSHHWFGMIPKGGLLYILHCTALTKATQLAQTAWLLHRAR